MEDKEKELEQDKVLKVAINEKQANKIIKKQEKKGRELEKFSSGNPQEGVLNIIMVFRQAPVIRSQEL